MNFLQNRGNSIFSDRIAIVGNMCDYKIRLPSRCLDKEGFFYSTCEFTQSILNGDMSLLAKYSDPYAQSHLSRYGYNSIGFPRETVDPTSPKLGFSWGPPPMAALRNIEFYDAHNERYQLRPAPSSLDGLQVRGMLWKMNRKVELPGTHAQYATEWQRIKLLDMRDF